MITNFNNKRRKDDIVCLCLLILAFLFVVWLCTPPGNKFAQLCFYGNNTQFLLAKFTKTKEELNEWLYHRNNAVYLVRMERKKEALNEMDKAIMTFPPYLPDSRLLELYSERAQMRIFNGDYSGALSDYMKLKDLSLHDKLRVALLFKQAGNNNYALMYCNSILNVDYTAYAGYACLADVYAGAGKYDVSVRVFDLLIDRSKNRARYYADRAYYKKICGDMDGYNADMQTARNLSHSIEPQSTLIRDTLKPKKLNFEILDK